MISEKEIIFSKISEEKQESIFSISCPSLDGYHCNHIKASMICPTVYWRL